MNSLLKIYHDLKESGSSSDFPHILADVMYKVLISKFKGVSSPWREYTTQSNLTDFKTNNRVIVSEAPDLLEIEENGPYTDSAIKDYNYQIKLKTYGRTFSINRQTVINDDLNALKQVPAMFGRSSARTLVKKIVNTLEGDFKTYDGVSLFGTHAGVQNFGNTALTNDAAGIAALSAAMTAVEKATEPHTGERMGIEAAMLLVPSDLEDVAMRITQGQNFYPVSTSGGTDQIGKVRRLKVVKEPFLTSTTGWYVQASPEDAPVIEVGFLGGKQEPDLLTLAATAVSLSGGEDPYGFEYDDMWFKVRHDWALALAMYQGIYRGKS